MEVAAGLTAANNVQEPLPHWWSRKGGPERISICEGFLSGRIGGWDAAKSVESDQRGQLTHRSKAGSPALYAHPGSGGGLAWIGRYLVILVFVLLLTMPMTERLWSWDRFTGGGEDFELGALLILSFLCLVLVLTRQCQQHVESSLSAWRVAVFGLVDRLVRGPGQVFDFYPETGSDPGSGRSEFPLQI